MPTALAARCQGGLSVAQLEFLSCLAENPAARPGQVARLLRLAPSSVATALRELTSAVDAIADDVQPEVPPIAADSASAVAG
jgi:hypothetical protein